MYSSSIVLACLVALSSCLDLKGARSQSGQGYHSSSSDQRLLMASDNGCTDTQVAAIQAAGERIVEYAQAAIHAIDCWDPKQYEKDIFADFFKRKVHASTVKSGMELVIDRLGEKSGGSKLPVFCMPQSFAHCAQGVETFAARESLGKDQVGLAKQYTDSPFLYVLGLCPKVWDKLAFPPDQCKPTSIREPLAKKLFHDVIEIVSGFEVGDLTPGLKASEGLAQSKLPDRALRNADSYAYFASLAWLGGWNKSDGVQECLKECKSTY